MTGRGGFGIRAVRRRLAGAPAPCLLALLAFCAATCSPQPAEQFSTEVSPTKPVEQLASDLSLITTAGYRRIGLFDLKGIQDTGSDVYFDLLRSYADRGVEISVFVQGMPASTAVELARRIGVSTAIVISRDLGQAFQQAGFKTVRWSLVADPETPFGPPTYMGWPDLRSDRVRSFLARRAVGDPSGAGGGLNLDYIRWNRTDQQRTAEQVTDLVRRIRASWSSARGPLSADVFPYLGHGNGDGGALDVGQRWDLWLAEGLVDEVCPMAYLSADLPWLIPQWAAYGRRVVPILSAVDVTR